MTPRLGVLLDMLTYCRPADDRTEHDFLQRFILPWNPSIDLQGNYHAVIPNTDGSPSRVLWSCHTDTVHYDGGRQTVSYNPRTGIVGLSKRSRYQDRRNCLGADDTAGVFLCCELIRANVPGHYIFHFAEERGGIGSSGLAHDQPGLIADLDFAIALDRRGTGDIITHQYGRRCASDLFALSLAEELNKSGLSYSGTHGVYTDTAEYADLIPECTNLSVGYQHEHSAHETLDTRHVFRLLAALIAVDPTELFIDRVAEPEVWIDDYTWPIITIAGRTAAPITAPIEWIDPDDDCNDTPPVDRANHPYLDQVYADVQADLQASMRRALSSHECDDCGAVTRYDELHECPYRGIRR